MDERKPWMVPISYNDPRHEAPEPRPAEPDADEEDGDDEVFGEIDEARPSYGPGAVNDDKPLDYGVRVDPNKVFGVEDEDEDGYDEEI